MASTENTQVVEENKVSNILATGPENKSEEETTSPTTTQQKLEANTTSSNSDNPEVVFESKENGQIGDESSEEIIINDKCPPKCDMVVDAHQLLSSGKRHLACDDYAQAVETLAQACESLSEKFGEQGIEVAEAYFYYGRSLLELARVENGVLGNALDGVAAEEENEADLSESDQFEKASTLPESERETIVTEVYSAMAAEENGESADSGNKVEQSEAAGEAETVKEEDNAVKDSVEDAKPEEDGNPEEEGDEEEGDEEGESAEDEGEEVAGLSQEEMEDADDVPNLQLAWEVLELAKQIYIKETQNEDCNTSVKAKLCEVYRVLGEVSLEAGSYEQAIQDMTSCLEWQSRCMDADDRRIAETHYQLGNAHILSRDYKLAVEHLHKSKSVIETRIANIESCEETEGKESREKEQSELKALLPDVIAKVEDVEDESLAHNKAESELKAMLASKQDAGTTTIGFGDAPAADGAATVIATKANDISNLVRKRKPEGQPEEEAKKARQEVANGDKENGATEVPAGDN